MKIKESFIVSASAIFALSWIIFYVLINGAQGVGDAPNSINPHLRSIWISLIVVFAYSILFFGICGLGILIKGKIKKWKI